MSLLPSWPPSPHYGDIVRGSDTPYRAVYVYCQPIAKAALGALVALDRDATRAITLADSTTDMTLIGQVSGMDDRGMWVQFQGLVTLWTD